MAKKKQNNIIWIIAIVIVIFFFMKGGEITEPSSSEDMNIVFRTRTAPSSMAVISGELVPDAEGQFGLSIGNSKKIPIRDVELSSKSDNSGGNFNAVSFPFTRISSLSADATSSSVNTAWFGLEWYASNSPGITRYTFNFQYDYTDAEGNIQSNIPIIGYADIEIYGDTCSDTTPLFGCNGAGDKCIYQEGAGTLLEPDAVCCANIGGSWTGSSCVVGCGSVPVGQCDTASTPGTVKKNTYCEPGTSTLVEDCTRCSCYDIYGSPNIGCNGNQCVFDTYAGAVNVRVIGTGVEENDCSSCGGWASGSCGQGTCTSDQRYQSRTCSPAGCTPTDGLGMDRCVADASCVTCDTGSWSNVGCGEGTCSGTQMYQVRSINPPGCADDSRCAIDASCSAIQFRTTSLTYNPGSAIGYSETCGNSLVGYGAIGLGSYTGKTCSKWASDLGYELLFVIPGGFTTGTGNMYLIDRGVDITVCQTYASDTTKIYLRTYKTTDSDASKVDTSQVSIDSSMEVTC